MEKQHLTYFKIENFKRFDSFEMSNLGQFNLIVGDNNVGKTSVLEALTFDKNLVSLAHNYYISTGARGMYLLSLEAIEAGDLSQTEFWSYIFKNLEKPINIEATDELPFVAKLSVEQYSQLTKKEKEYVEDNFYSSAHPKSFLRLENINASKKEIPQIISAYFENDEFNSDHFVPYLSANISYGKTLVQYFYEYLNGNKQYRKEFEKNLRSFIPRLEEVRVHKFFPAQEMLSITLANDNSIFPITRYGDGTVKLTRILIELLITKSKRLMVDEIGAGIHFTRLKDYWKIIIQLCVKYSVQLFASTHSLECQQAFIEALEDPEMHQYQKDARNISLIENKQGVVEAITFDFEQFEYALNIGFNTRGGKA